MKRILTLLWLVSLAVPAISEPRPYDLDLDDSKVVFFYDLAGRETQGVFPVSWADTVIDLQDVRRSSIDVQIATKFVRAGDAFVTLAIRGPDLLATGKHPYARFTSTRVVPNADGARITGDLTLKGITHPVSLDAKFMRRADAPADNSEIILQVEGTVSRKAFGVTGFADIVGDDIVLRFRVHLTRA